MCAGTRTAATSRSRIGRGISGVPCARTRRRSIRSRRRTRSNSSWTSSSRWASSCGCNWRTSHDVFHAGGDETNPVDQVRPPQPGRDPADVRDEDHHGGDVTEVGYVTKETAREAQKRQRCPHCGEEQGKVTLDKPTTFREDGHKLTPKEVRERLERIPNEDLRVLGMNPEVARPEWMVLTALLVPPVTVRPSITLESGDRSEDDLTHKLVDVLRINQRLRENRDAGAPQLIVEDLWELLQYHVTTYFDNQTSGIPPARHRSGRPLKTLVQRLKGKEGRFRSNLSGKRVNFSAQTVISSDPILSINEVGVPDEAARELTVHVHVQAYNSEIVKQWEKRGSAGR